MEYRKFGEQYVVRLDKGEEICSCMIRLCAWRDIKTAQVTGIGAVNQVTAGLFDTEKKEFTGNTWTGDMEIVSLAGNITTKDKGPYAHLHIAVADREGQVKGGHLKEAVVSATAEMIITVIEGLVDRRMDEEIGLNLIKF